MGETKPESWAKKSRLGTRVLVAVTLGPVVLGSAYLGRLYFFAVVGIIVVAALFEYYILSGTLGARPIRWVGLVASGALLWAYYSADWALAGASVAFLVGIASMHQVFRGPDGSVRHLATTVFGPLYVAGLFGHLLLVRQLPEQVDLPYRYAGMWILALFLIVWICDTAAFFAGSSFGRHKLAPRVSPNKTWEGAIAGLVFAVLSAFLFKPILLRGLGAYDALAIGLIVGLFGQISDLTESLLKRDAGVKDSSSLIPGHGGMLDRFDSLLLIAPALYWYLRLVAFR